MKKIVLLILSTCAIHFASTAQKLVKTYYDYNHQHVKETYYTDNYGNKNGAYTEYSEYGGILQQGTYKNDIAIGKWIYKDSKGNPSMEVNYDDQGKNNGRVLRYEDGHPAELQNFVHGDKSGIGKTWYTAEDGENAFNQIHEEERFMKAADGSDSSLYKEYNLSGKIIKEGSNVNGASEGVWNFYYADGPLQETDTYHYGMQCGDCYYYNYYRYENDNLGVILKYKHYVVSGGGITGGSYADMQRTDSLDLGKPNISDDSLRMRIEEAIAKKKNMQMKRLNDGCYKASVRSLVNRKRQVLIIQEQSLP